MKTKYIVPIIATSLLLSGCSWRDLIYQPRAQEPVTTTINDNDYSYYSKSETTGYDWNNNPYIVTTETLFGCPNKADKSFGSIVIMRNGSTGQLNGNYKEEQKDYKTDKCFATFTDMDTGEIYYQLYRQHSTEIIHDANTEYIVVPQDVFFKLIEQ